MSSIQDVLKKTSKGYKETTLSNTRMKESKQK